MLHKIIMLCKIYGILNSMNYMIAPVLSSVGSASVFPHPPAEEPLGLLSGKDSVSIFQAEVM